MRGVKHNGITISIQYLPGRVKPCLCVEFEGENNIYKIASFNGEKTAHWFDEILDEFFKGLVQEE